MQVLLAWLAVAGTSEVQYAEWQPSAAIALTQGSDHSTIFRRAHLFELLSKLEQLRPPDMNSMH